jgi:protein SCO1/2
MGRVYVADFFFTKCPTICPKLTEALVEVQAALKDHRDFRILSHSLDPLNDSTAALRVYAEKNGAIDGLWYFLTGDQDDIYGLAEKAYFNTAKYGDGSPDGILHNPLLILVDRSGVIRGYYDSQDSAAVQDLIAAAERLLEP